MQVNSTHTHIDAYQYESNGQESNLRWVGHIVATTRKTLERLDPIVGTTLIILQVKSWERSIEVAACSLAQSQIELQEASD